MMKKVLIGIAALVVVVAGVGVYVYLSAGDIIKQVVEGVGSRATQTQVTLREVDLSLPCFAPAHGPVGSCVRSAIDPGVGQRCRHGEIELRREHFELDGAPERIERGRREGPAQITPRARDLAIALREVVRSVKIAQEEFHRGSGSRVGVQVTIGLGETRSLPASQLAQPVGEFRC